VYVGFGSSMGSISTSHNNSVIDIDNLETTSSEFASADNVGLVLVAQLRCKTVKLPITVHIATLDDPWARFSADPTLEVADFENPWEMVDKAV
jgi:hypothetical protein